MAATRSDQRSLRVLLLHEDHKSLWSLERRLRSALPHIECLRRNKPDTSGDFDVYFIGTTFDSKPIFAELIQQVRAQQREAQVIAFGALLDRPTLKTLLQTGCDGVIETSAPEDFKIVMERLQRLERSREENRGRAQSGLASLIRSMSSLLRDWNRCLLRQEALTHEQRPTEATDQPESNEFKRAA